MKTLNKMKYNFKKLLPMAALAIMPAMVACEKDDPKPQKTEAELRAERIAELIPLEKTQAKAVRDAVAPATQGWEVSYWMAFGKLSGAVNLLDSARRHVEAINFSHNLYGNPLPAPANDAAVVVLENNCKTYIPTATELDSLQKVR